MPVYTMNAKNAFTQLDSNGLPYPESVLTAPEMAQQKAMINKSAKKTIHLGEGFSRNALTMFELVIMDSNFRFIKQKVMRRFFPTAKVKILDGKDKKILLFVEFIEDENPEQPQNAPWTFLPH